MNFKDREFRDRPEAGQTPRVTGNLDEAKMVTGACIPQTMIERLEAEREGFLQNAADLSKAIQALKRHPELEDAFAIMRRFLF